MCYKHNLQFLHIRSVSLFFRDPEYQGFLWTSTRELLKKYIPPDIDKLLDVTVDANNKPKK